MYERVSVEDAIAKGKRRINYPVLGIFLIGITLFSVLGFDNHISAGFAITGALLCTLVLPWLYWSWAVPRWRLWAFENVRNVHKLQKKAVEEQIIWRKGHWCEKTEIWTAAQRIKWAQLQEKFVRPDMFEDDYTIPSETQVYYSKVNSYAECALGLFFIGAGIFCIVSKYSIVVGVGGVLFGGYMLYSGFKKAGNSSAQLILSNEGIWTTSTPFYRWDEISDEDVIRERSGKHVHYYLVYNHPMGQERIMLGEYTCSRDRLEKLLNTYRGRSNKRLSK